MRTWRIYMTNIRRMRKRDAPLRLVCSCWKDGCCWLKCVIEMFCWSMAVLGHNALIVESLPVESVAFLIAVLNTCWNTQALHLKGIELQWRIFESKVHLASSQSGSYIQEIVFNQQNDEKKKKYEKNIVFSIIFFIFKEIYSITSRPLFCKDGKIVIWQDMPQRCVYVFMYIWVCVGMIFPGNGLRVCVCERTWVFVNRAGWELWK